MQRTLPRTVPTLLLAALAAGCAHQAEAPEKPPVKAEAGHATAPDLGKQRLMLSEGYSLLYQDAGNLDRVARRY